MLLSNCSACGKKKLRLIKNESNDLAKRTTSDIILKDRVYEIAISPEYDGYKKD